eukprot:176763-Pleurochrysis_carterae.AAC.5
MHVCMRRAKIRGKEPGLAQVYTHVHRQSRWVSALVQRQSTGAAQQPGAYAIKPCVRALTRALETREVGACEFNWS